MKILRTNQSFSHLSENSHRSLANNSKRKAKAQEFRTVLEQVTSEQSEEGEEFRVLFPQHGRFWDNGYEDLD